MTLKQDGARLIADLISRLGSHAKSSAAPHWVYHTAQGKAVLSRGDLSPLKKIGAFKTEQLAREACERHFKSACRGLQSLGKLLPTVHFP